MNKADNTLKNLVTLFTIMSLIYAIKTSYPAVDICDMTLNIAGKFVTCELFFFLIIYVLGTMLADAMPGLWEYSVQAKHKLRAANHKESIPQLVQSVEKNDESMQPVPDERGTLENFENEVFDRIGTKLTTTNSPNIIVLSEEIINYVTKTFENILTQENIEKLLNNFRKLNTRDLYEVIEKKKLDNVLEFDLAHFAWNVCKRIYDKNTCLVKFTEATAEIIKASFPLTLLNYDVVTLKQRLRDSAPTTKFRLPIIEIGEELVPFDWNKKNDANKK